MGLLKRNLRKIAYLAPDGSEETLVGGKHTGRHQQAYAEPKWMRGNIGLPTGFTSSQLFGTITDYSHVLVLNGTGLGLEETGAFEYGDRRYDIRAIRESLNFTAVALRQQTKGRA